jgi:STE24 endopeptidase
MFFLRYLNYRNRNAPIPENVKDVYDAETYKKRNDYEMENTKFGVISGLTGLVLSCVFLILNVHSWLFEYIDIAESAWSVYLRTYFMFGMIAVINLIVDTAFGAYDTFKIEAKYGFNKATVGTFIGDIVKRTLIMVIVFGGLMTAFMAIYNAVDNWVFLIFIAILVVLVLIIMFFQPVFIKIFNKMTPMEDGTLKVKINELARKTGYPVKRIFVIDGSRRSTKMNAFCTGFGSNRTIALYDTLINKCSEEEVVAVLAHEIGHAKLHHIPKLMLSMVLQFLPFIALAYFIVGQVYVSEAFGFAGLNVGFGLFISMTLITPIMLLLSVPRSYFSRKYEYEADAYAAKHAGKLYGITALKKIYGDAYANLTPHPFVVQVMYSHPTVSQRVTAINKLHVK